MLAQVLNRLGETEALAVWLRWVARDGSQWPMGPAAPSLRRSYEAALQSVADDAQSEFGVAETRWAWPEGFDGEEQGLFAVESTEPGVRFTVTVAGPGALAPGQTLSLPAGTYDLLAAADDYESVRVRREILPGITTRLSFDMLPELPSAVAQGVARNVVGIRRSGEPASLCTNGVAWRDGLVLTPLSSLVATSGLEVVTPSGGVIPDVEVVEPDPETDLAILSVAGGPVTSLSAAQLPTGQAFGWSVFRPTCDATTSAVRTRVTGRGTGITSAVLPPRAAGAPLVVRDGGVIGVVAANGDISPIRRAEQLAEQTLAQLEGGGFPVAWVVGGWP